MQKATGDSERCRRPFGDPHTQKHNERQLGQVFDATVGEQCAYLAGHTRSVRANSAIDAAEQRPSSAASFRREHSAANARPNAVQRRSLKTSSRSVRSTISECVAGDRTESKLGPKVEEQEIEKV